MGQEQSTSTAQGNVSPTGSAGSGGVSSSFSFLSRKRNLAKSSHIVVVNVNTASSSADDAKNDEDLKRIKEITRFFPILRGVLPGLRDPPEVRSKVDPKYIYRFLKRTQEHFGICCQTVGTEQAALSTQIMETDQLITLLTTRIIDAKKRHDHFVREMKKIETISEHMQNIQILLQEIVPCMEFLNELLPETERLPPLQNDLGPKPLKFVSVDETGLSKADDNGLQSPSIKVIPAEEFSVVDRS